MSGSEGTPPGRPVPRRPAFYSPEAMEAHGGVVLDPAVQSEIAHETAQIIVHAGRAATDPAVTDRLVRLTDDLGLSTLADLWAPLPAHSLPGALWRLYALREWVVRDADGASRDYEAGHRHADVLHAITGVAEPPGPVEVKELADAILRGVFSGDLDVALERAGAFCRIVAAGRAHRADGSGAVFDDDEGEAAWLKAAGNMQVLGQDLETCARLWRRGDLL